MNKRGKFKHNTFWEIILILASVLIFRGLWLLLDRYLGTAEASLWISLIIGLIIASFAIFQLYNRK